MAFKTGSEFMIEVQLGDASWVLVNDMNSFSKQGQRNTNTFPVFQRATPYTVAAGAKEQTYTISGLFNPGDAGQARLLAQEAANAAVSIRITWDGTNGFTQSVKCTSYTHDATPEDPQEISFEFSAEADAVIVGTGPIL